MKNTNPFYRLIFVIISILIFKTQIAFAEKFKVKKVKGNQAIIETSAQLEEGQTYELLSVDKVSQDVDYKSNVLKPRKNSLSLGGELNFLRSDTYQSNNYSVDTRYGWNFSNMELGVRANLVSKDVGAGTTTSVIAGGYFDYNFVANRDPKKLIYGALGALGFGSTSYPGGTSGPGGSSTLIELNAGGFITYFIDNSSTALRAETYVIYQQVNTSTSQGNLTGLGGRGLLVFYF